MCRRIDHHLARLAKLTLPREQTKGSSSGDHERTQFKTAPALTQNFVAQGHGCRSRHAEKHRFTLPGEVCFFLRFEQYLRPAVFVDQHEFFVERLADLAPLR